MSKSSVPSGPAPADPSKRWGPTLTNLLVLPGLGTLLAGRRWTGLAQMALTLCGVVLSFVGVVRALRLVLALTDLPEQTPDLTLMFVGVALFLLGWVWAAISSVQVHRAARRPPAEDARHESRSPAPPRL